MYFPTAAAVTAPAGALSVFPHCRSSDCSRRSAICISPLSQQCLLPQELSVFPHYRSSVCSHRSLFCTSPLPQQCLLPQERYLYFPTTAVVSAPAGALSVFPHCRSSVCSRRSLFYIPPLPQQCLLPQEPFLYSSTAAGACISTSLSAVLSRLRRSTTTTSSVQHPVSPKLCKFWGVLLAHFGCCPAIIAFWGSVLGPGYTPISDPSPRSGGVPRARE